MRGVRQRGSTGRGRRRRVDGEPAPRARPWPRAPS